MYPFNWRNDTCGSDPNYNSIMTNMQGQDRVVFYEKPWPRFPYTGETL